MKIKRFFAEDMRQALSQVREALGADAVILSNKSVDGGVELVAATDYDEAAFGSVDESTAMQPTLKPVLQRPKVAPRTVTSTRRPSRPAVTAQSSTLPTTRPKSINAEQPQAEIQEKHSRIEWSQDPVLQEMRQEMQALRRMMENELSELTWRDLGQRRPQTQELIRRLMGLELGAGICRDLAHQAEDAETLEKAWHLALFHLTNMLPVQADDLLDQGGVIALVGPTGVGKTTTIAKLAARFCLRHGNRQLALITTDSYRIGAQEQLHNYGQILDVPVRTATTADELSHALHGLSEKRLILIDTAGMGQRDHQLAERLGLLSGGNHPLKTLLTLSATTQRSAITHAIRSFGLARPVGAVLTKMDEATALGGVFSALIEAELPLTYVTDGQRVPEDLHIARAHVLVEQATELAQAMSESPDEHCLALAFGGMAEHVHV